MTTTMALNSPNESNTFSKKVNQVKDFFKLPTSEQKAIILDTAKENLNTLAIGVVVGAGVVTYQNSDAIREVFDNPNDPNKKEVVAPVVNATDTMDPKNIKLDAFTKTLEEENKKANNEDLEGGDGSDPENLGTGQDNEEYKKFIEIFGGDPTFSIANGVLKVEGGNDKLQKAVNDFNKLQNQELKDLTLKYIQQVLNDDNFEDRQKRMIIASFVQAAQGIHSRAYGQADDKYTDAYKEIAKLAGNQANVDDEGNVVGDYSEYAQYADEFVEHKNKGVEKSEKEAEQSKEELEAELAEIEQLLEDIELSDKRIAELKKQRDELKQKISDLNNN